MSELIANEVLKCVRKIKALPEPMLKTMCVWVPIEYVPEHPIKKNANVHQLNKFQWVLIKNCHKCPLIKMAMRTHLKK